MSKASFAVECFHRSSGIRSGYTVMNIPLGILFQFNSKRQLYKSLTGGGTLDDGNPSLYAVYGGGAGRERFMNGKEFLAEYEAGLEAKKLAHMLKEKAATTTKRRGL
jgi:hypothetical protein